MNYPDGYNWRLFAFLTAAAYFAFFANLSIGISELTSAGRAPSLGDVAVYAGVNLAGITLVCFAGYWLSIRSGFFIYSSHPLRLTTIWVPVASGVILAAIAIASDFLLFNGAIEDKVRSAGGILSRLGLVYSAAVGEEIFFRLFLMSGVVWIAGKKIEKAETSAWIGIIVSAAVFASAHLTQSAEISWLAVVRTLLLNGAGGLIMGWMYWKRGWVSAVLVHFTADVTIYFLFYALII